MTSLPSSTTTTASMTTWRISLLSLLLAMTAFAEKDDNFLIVDKDETVGVLNHHYSDASIKSNDDREQGHNDMSWQAAEEIVDAIREFGNITRNVDSFLHTFYFKRCTIVVTCVERGLLNLHLNSLVYRVCVHDGGREVCMCVMYVYYQQRDVIVIVKTYVWTINMLHPMLDLSSIYNQSVPQY